MIRRPNRPVLVCIRCEEVLSPDEHLHYGVQCHVCVMREHDAALVLAGDPDHPDRDWFEASPIDLTWRGTVRRARAA